MSGIAAAEIFYGYSWDPELVEDEGLVMLGSVSLDVKWWRTLLHERGTVDPYETLPTTEHLGDEEARTLIETWQSQNDAAINQWRVSASAIQSEFGCDIGWHGGAAPEVVRVLAGDGSVVHEQASSPDGALRLPHVFVTASIQSTDHWEAKPINVDLLVAEEDWDQRLLDFAAALMIDLTSAVGPRWFLSAGVS